jgi:hypothetical protein
MARRGYGPAPWTPAPPHIANPRQIVVKVYGNGVQVYDGSAITACPHGEGLVIFPPDPRPAGAPVTPMFFPRDGSPPQPMDN